MIVKPATEPSIDKIYYLCYFIYMSHLYSRKQLKVNDERQLFSPDQLEPGMSIAVVSILEGTSKQMRALQAGASFLKLLSVNEDESRLQAGRRGWQHKGLSGLLPEWVGVVEGWNDEGVRVELTGLPEDPNDFANLINIDPAELPAVIEPARRFSLYSSMGLAKITPPNIHLRPGTATPHAGMWEQNATLLIER